ncbi:MAG: hypothetical protein Q4A79_02825 [Candidatus Saccharibacteria bacterium]|nr:hypothetical protein [Candidatus Saccharibacteria bacterium]
MQNPINNSNLQQAIEDITSNKQSLFEGQLEESPSLTSLNMEENPSLNMEESPFNTPLNNTMGPFPTFSQNNLNSRPEPTSLPKEPLNSPTDLAETFAAPTHPLGEIADLVSERSSITESLTTPTTISQPPKEPSNPSPIKTAPSPEIKTPISSESDPEQIAPKFTIEQTAPKPAIEETASEPSLEQPTTASPEEAPKSPSNSLEEPLSPTSEPLKIKENALRELIPLLNNLDLTAEEKFVIYKKYFDAFKDSSFLSDAYRVASEIADQNERARAFLYLIEFIDETNLN